ncbi:hypothetical protein vseg_000647 [Gypsophila vaccaria]
MNHKFPSSIDNNNNNNNPPNPNFPPHSLPGYAGGEVRGRELEYRRNGVDVRGSILRELEKERIRAELIAEEVMIRRRVLEEEVRREMMLERELYARRCGPPMFGVGTMRLERPRVGLETIPREAMRLEQTRVGLETMHRDAMRFESPQLRLETMPRGAMPQRVPLLMNSEAPVGVGTVPFQRDPVVGGSGNGGVVKEVNGVISQPEGNKDKVIILAKPSTNLADIKRKAMAQSAGGAIEILKKQKTGEDWSCALCRITATSERGLNEHLQGRKHKARERRMVAQKIGFGLGSTASLKKDENQTVIISEETFAIERENQVPVAPATNKPKKKFRYFCEMCKAGAYSLKVFNKHSRSNKHMSNLSKLNKSDDALQIEASVEIAVMEENKEAEMSGKETKEDTEREQVTTNRDDVSFDLDQVEDMVEVPETKGDDVDGEVNRVEDRGMVLETEADDVGSDVNQVEVKVEVPETKGDNVDGEIIGVEGKGMVLETEADDVGSEVNRVEVKVEVPETKGDNVDGEITGVEDKGMALETEADDVGSGVNLIEDKAKILETKAQTVDSYVNRAVDKVEVLEAKGDSVDGEVKRAEVNWMSLETKADKVGSEVNQVEDLVKVLETKGDNVDDIVNPIEEKVTVLEIVG